MFLMLIHGWCCNSGFWRHQVPAFAAKGHHVVAPDLRPRRQPGDAITTFAEVVTDAAHGRTDIVLIGHSMGGPVAVEAAILLGTRCRLVLGVDTFTDAAFYAARPAEEIVQRTQTFAADFAGTMQSMAERLIAGDNKPALLPWVAAEMAAIEPEAALWALRSLLAWDIGVRLPAVHGRIETINSAWLDRQCTKIAGLERVRVHSMEGVGHFPMLEAPQRFNALVLAVLGGL